MTDLDHHPERVGLLRGILEHPGDRVRRLVFADWLEDNGLEGPRCDLIRGTRSRLEADELALAFPREAAIAAECGAGVAHAVTWASADAARTTKAWHQPAPPRLPPVPPLLVFVQGFLYLARVPLATWERHGPYLVHHHPMGWVEPTDKAPLVNSQWDATAPAGWPEPTADRSQASWGLPPWLHSRLRPKMRWYDNTEEAMTALANGMLSWAWDKGGEQP